MIRIDKVEVQTLSTDRLYVRWTVGTTTEDLRDYSFTIGRSESYHGPWDILAENVIDKYEVVDESIDLRHGWRKYYYQVTAKHRTTGETFTSEPATLEAPPDLIALEIRRREMMYFKEFVGRRVVVFKRKTFGTRCGCWDEETGKRMVSRCAICYDTGFVGGYLRPWWMWMQLSPPQEMVRYLRETELGPQAAVALTAPVPALDPGDMVVEFDSGIRWRVTAAKRTERFRSPVHQELSLVKIPPGDIEYTVPVNLEDAFDLYYAKRNQTMTIVGSV